MNSSNLGSNRSLFRQAVAVTVILLASASPSHAYVDPGTGSMLLQLGIAAIASVMFYFRHLRMQVTDWFRRVVLRRESELASSAEDLQSGDRAPERQ